MYGVIANVVCDRVLRIGAKVWVEYCNGDLEKPIVCGISKSGRRVRKYTHFKRLTNVRAAWIPENLREDIGLCWGQKEEAQAFAIKVSEMWAGARCYSRDGRILIIAGVTAREARRRALNN